MQDIKLVIVNIPDTGDFTGLDNALAVLRGSPLVVLAVQDVALDRHRSDRSEQLHQPALG